MLCVLCNGIWSVTNNREHLTKSGLGALPTGLGAYKMSSVPRPKWPCPEKIKILALHANSYTHMDLSSLFHSLSYSPPLSLLPPYPYFSVLLSPSISLSVYLWLFFYIALSFILYPSLFYISLSFQHSFSFSLLLSISSTLPLPLCISLTCLLTSYFLLPLLSL